MFRRLLPVAFWALGVAALVLVLYVMPARLRGGITTNQGILILSIVALLFLFYRIRTQPGRMHIAIPQHRERQIWNLFWLGLALVVLSFLWLVGAYLFAPGQYIIAIPFIILLSVGLVFLSVKLTLWLLRIFGM